MPCESSGRFFRATRYILFFGNSPTGQTRRWILTLNGLNDANSGKAVPFGDFVDITPIQFWGQNRRFQAKRAKYWKYHIIDNAVSSSTKNLGQRYRPPSSLVSRVVPICAQQIKDGGRPPFENALNRHISVVVWPILMTCSVATHVGPQRLT